MLTDEQREELRLLISEKIAEAQEEIAALEARTNPIEPDVAIGRLSRLDSMVNAGTAEMALDEARKRLNRLREKLPRVDEQDFGTCAMCRTAIPMERLRAAPDRGVCVPCLNQAKAKRR